MIGRLLRNKRASIALVVGLLIVPLVLFVAMAIDIAAQKKQLQDAQQALDIAMLTATKVYAEEAIKTQSHDKAFARAFERGNAYLRANFHHGATPIQFDFLIDEKAMFIGRVFGLMKTSFGSVFGAELLPIEAQACSRYAPAQTTAYLAQCPPCSGERKVIKGACIPKEACETSGQRRTGIQTNTIDDACFIPLTYTAACGYVCP